jgi:hypothetical protein
MFYLVLFVAFVRNGDAVVGWAWWVLCPHRGAGARYERRRRAR